MKRPCLTDSEVRDYEAPCMCGEYCDCQAPPISQRMHVKHCASCKDRIAAEEARVLAVLLTIRLEHILKLREARQRCR